MNKSEIISSDNYFYVFLPDRIAVSYISNLNLWDEYRKNNDNWITIQGVNQQRFYLEGTDNSNIKVVPVTE